MDYHVNKDRLIDQLAENRAKHVEAYQLAIEKYRAKAIEFFNEAIDKVKAGGEVERALRLPMPEEHTEDFDRAIEGLSWHQGEFVDLDEFKFEQLVRNRWGWHQTFTSNTTSYLSS